MNVFITLKTCSGCKVKLSLPLVELEYVMLTAVDPGMVTSHVKWIVSLLERIEQLNGIMSPGHWMSPLDIIGSKGTTDAVAINAEKSKHYVAETVSALPITRVHTMLLWWRHPVTSAVAYGIEQLWGMVAIITVISHYSSFPGMGIVIKRSIYWSPRVTTVHCHVHRVDLIFSESLLPRL